MDFIPTALCEKKLLVLKLQWPSLSTSPLSEVTLSGYSSFFICFFRGCAVRLAAGKKAGEKSHWLSNVSTSLKAQMVMSLQCRRPGFDPWVRKIPWRRKWQPTPVLLPGKSYGRRSLVGYSPWDHKELDTTQQLHWMNEWSCSVMSDSLRPPGL